MRSQIPEFHACQFTSEFISEFMSEQKESVLAGVLPLPTLAHNRSMRRRHNPSLATSGVYGAPR